MQRKFDLRRELSQKYIKKGPGIEIGPTFLPVPLKKGIKVTYVDVVDTPTLLKTYPDLKTKPVVPIDVVDDGETLTKFKDSSVHFIIANHFLEHTVDPLKTIKNFLRVLKPDGLIFMAIPDMRATFDRDRLLTPVDHFIRVHEQGKDPDLNRHYEECVRLIEKKPAAEVKARVKFLKDTHFSIHYHTFTLENFLPLIEYLQQQGVTISLVTTRDLEPGTDEFIVLLSKAVSPKSPKATSSSRWRRLLSHLFS